MVVACHPHWRRKQPSRKTRDAVLWALRSQTALTVDELASEANLPRDRAGRTLDHLRVRQLVELGDDGKFRKVETA